MWRPRIQRGDRHGPRVLATSASANVEYLVLQGTADLQGYGNDQSNAISGNSGSNVINGGGGPDIVIGGRGDDVALLGAGDDTFVWNPGDGNDTVEGQAGADTLHIQRRERERKHQHLGQRRTRHVHP